MTFTLPTLDLVIIIGYLIFIVLLGLRFAKRQDSAEDYFLAGRTLGWPLIGFSLFASNQSTSSLVGMAGSGYATGLSVYNYEWFAVVVLILFAVFFLPYYLRAKIFTLPEYLERRFDARSRYYHSVVTIIGNLAIDTAGSLYAGSLIIQLIFPDVPMWQSVAALAAFTGMYTILGGLAAVVYTDMFQSILLLIGSIVITVLAFIKIGSWDAVEAVARPEQLHLIQPASDETLPWPGLLTGVPLLGFYYWCSNQYIVQRALGARTTQQGQWGALFGGLLKVPVLFIMVMPGLMALVLYPNIENPNLVFPTLMFDLLPTGILGLVLAGFIAALMSSVDSALNAASTLATMDFYQKARPKADARKLMQTGRVFTLVFVVIAALIAPQIDRFPTLWEYLQAVLAYIAPPVVASFVLGMFWKRATPAASFAGLIGGGAVALFLLFGQGVLVPEIHFLYVATLLFALSAVIMIVVSFFTAETAQAKLDQYTWSCADYERESATLETLPWYYNYRYQSVALLAVTLMIVIYFW